MSDRHGNDEWATLDDWITHLEEQHGWGDDARRRGEDPDFKREAAALDRRDYLATAMAYAEDVDDTPTRLALLNLIRAVER